MVEGPATAKCVQPLAIVHVFIIDEVIIQIVELLIVVVPVFLALGWGLLGPFCGSLLSLFLLLHSPRLMATILLNWRQSVVKLDPCNHRFDQLVEPALAVQGPRV